MGTMRFLRLRPVPWLSNRWLSVPILVRWNTRLQSILSLLHTYSEPHKTDYKHSRTAWTQARVDEAKTGNKQHCYLWLQRRCYAVSNWKPLPSSLKVTVNERITNSVTLSCPGSSSVRRISHSNRRVHRLRKYEKVGKIENSPKCRWCFFNYHFFHSKLTLA